MAKINELAVVDAKKVQLLPSSDDLDALREAMEDMDNFPYGRIQIAAGGANVFKVTEPGEEDSTPATEIQGVILFSHRANGLWLGELGKGDDKTPACSSMDGAGGIVADTGEFRACDACPYNQYGSANNGSGRGKACKNMRRLYIVRSRPAGEMPDVLPLVLTLPPSALSAFDKYRTKIMLGLKKVYGVVTKITLKSQKNKDGIEYSTPVFDAVAVLPPGEAERVRQYAEQFSGAAKKAGLSSDDYASPDANAQGRGPSERSGPPPLDGEFSTIPDDDELPF